MRKGELVDGVSRVMMATDLRGSHSRAVIDGHVLKAPDSVPVGGLKAHNLHVCLNLGRPQNSSYQTSVNSTILFSLRGNSYT